MRDNIRTRLHITLDELTFYLAQVSFAGEFIYLNVSADYKSRDLICTISSEGDRANPFRIDATFDRDNYRTLERTFWQLKVTEGIYTQDISRAMAIIDKIKWLTGHNG